jgi:hypothetical protein
MYKPEEVEEATYGWTLVSKAKDLAKKFQDNITKAVAEIEKLENGLSKNPTVDAELRKYNEEIEVDEKISDIFKANKEGESIDDIAKRLKLSTSMVKKLIGEANIDTDNVDKEKDTSKEKELKIKLDKEKDQDALEKQLIAAQGQINILKQKLENEKNKVIKPEPNPETGEVPLTIGIAHAEFKKEKEKKEVKEARYEVSSTVTYQGVRGEDEVMVVVDAINKQDAEDASDEMIDNLRRKKKIGPKTGGQVKDSYPFEIERTTKKVGSYEGMMESMSKAERDKRIQRAKDMIKYYDAQKKAALKGPNKALAKKMLKNETELEEMKKDDAYAIGMAQAKKSMNDEPPLDKKTITKGHEIAKKILNKEEVAIVYTDKKTRQVVSKKFKNDAEARKWIKQFDGAAGQINFKPSSMLKNDVNEVSDKLKLKVLQKKIKQYKDKVFKKTMSTVKSPLFAGVEEALEIKEFTSQMIDRLKKSFSTAPKRISPEQANALSRHLDRIELNDLRKLVKANIPFVSTVARNKIYKKTGKFEETNLEEKRLYVEAIAGLQKKADKSGMSYSILKQVYDRGMAAWKSGHRPGASQQQWAFARVNSFITKSSGTWGGADKDLAAKVKGSK